MSSAQRRYLLVEQGLGAGVFNLVLNALIAWLMFRGRQTVPLWGEQSIAGDTIGTSFLLPFLTCQIVTRLAHRQVRAGRLVALGWTRAAHPWLGWLPRGTGARGAVLGLAGVAVLAPAAIAMVRGLGAAPMSLWGFVTFKAGFAAAAALLVTPLVALWAIAEAPGLASAGQRG
jgi:hypothetical protein